MYSIFTMRRAAFGAVLLCSGFAAASPLFRAGGDTVPTRILVHYGDLDLSQPRAAELTALHRTKTQQSTAG